MNEIVIDACLALHFIFPSHSYHPHVNKFFVDYARYVLIAPPLFQAEADSNLRYMMTLGKYTPQSRQALRAILDALPIVIEHDSTLGKRAWIIADRIGAIRVYDCTYAALAEARGCEFWTADKKFFNAAHTQFPFVRFVGSY